MFYFGGNFWTVYSANSECECAAHCWVGHPGIISRTPKTKTHQRQLIKGGL